MDNQLKIFTAPGCGPCVEIKEALDSGRLVLNGEPVAPEDVELVDVSTDQGYPLLDQLGIHAVPAVYLEGRHCEVLVDDETQTVTVTCPPTLVPSDEAVLDHPEI